MKKLLFAAAFTLTIPGLAWGWGQPHHAITRAAVEVLPLWQKDLLGPEAKALGDLYCMIPDNVFSDKENAKFAKMESKPGEVYLKILHLPTQQEEYLEVIGYFMERAVKALAEKDVGSAARYTGTICHLLEDYGSPSHTVPGDNMFTLLQQFLPPTDIMKGKLMHGPIENGHITVSISGYKPALLGRTVPEAAWRLMHRVHEGIINARSTTVPIIQALYAGDSKLVEKHQLRAATVDAKVVADAVFTILSLGAQKFEPAEEATLTEVKIGTFFPKEALSLYYPQAEFYSSPHWGHPHSGEILAGGTDSMPLKLLTPEGEKTFANGISAGMGKNLTFVLPKRTYTRFTVLAGLHPQLGAKGRVEFIITGDGKPLSSITLKGTDPATRLECDVTGVTQLQLTLQHRGLDTKSNYAIWAEPTLSKTK